ncbi:YajQ family cyclic di-GMP-binding protein [Marinobacterium weihaiense]|uniref:Nucleotide-binding protein KTN04_07045 n=1 Tax=Marinobacterium weihaiense TaxID=2851016 RepID=A0ABS6MA99_9GAMM|nr:YajQ family cyclic di-GMP-binding protein [Marinobacterium weihaiense]MBV0933090.1 YajQ family cyclic di-GMP-binding protein [Marinobacterium weihaiense]
MPSFDVVSELDMHEVTNAVDQANRELQSRYDFKGVQAGFEQSGENVTLEAEVDFQLQQMLEMLKSKLTSRKIDIKCMEVKEPDVSGVKAKQEVVLRQGLDQPMCKKIGKVVKDAKLKVQTQIQGDKVRVTGKKRDDLQDAIALLREADIELPLQFNNFRD